MSSKALQKPLYSRVPPSQHRCTDIFILTSASLPCTFGNSIIGQCSGLIGLGPEVFKENTHYFLSSLKLRLTVRKSSTSISV